MRLVRSIWQRRWVRMSILPTALACAVVLSTSETARSAIGHAIANPGSILDARSPGGRAPGALYQTKRAYARSAPHQRVLPGVRDRSTGLPGGAPLVGDTFGPGGVAGPLGGGVPESFGQSGPLLGPGAILGPTTPGFIGGAPILPDVEGSPPPPEAAIPEPTEWALMLVGIGLIGGMLRRGRRIAGEVRGNRRVSPAE